jgi:hypothetical protein
MNILPELFIHFACAGNECFLPLRQIIGRS